MIVVDDGSPDGTEDVVKCYQGGLKYIYQDNGGVSKARNTGIMNARGDYLAFLDADDVWDRNKLEIQVRCFQLYPEVNLIFGNFRCTKNQSILENRRYEDSFNIFKEYNLKLESMFESSSLFNHDEILIEFFWGKLYWYLFLGNFILPSSVILRKESLNKVGMFDEKYRVAEETEFFLRYSRDNTLGFISNPLVSYEVPQSGNLSGKKNMEALMKNAIRIQIDSLLENHIWYENEKKHFQYGLSVTYRRLAYYYLSELQIFDSRKYAIYSINAAWYNFRSYLVLFLSYMPESVLKYLSRSKRRYQGKKQAV